MPLRIDILRQLDHFQVGGGDTLAKAFRKGQEEENNPVLLSGVKESHHAKIHQRYATIIGKEDISRMGITEKDRRQVSPIHFR